MSNDETAKAVQEVAKFGQKSLDVSSEAGGFLARVFEKPIENFAAALADTTAGYRAVNRERVVQKTQRRLAQLGVTNRAQIPPRTGLPLLEGFSDESDEDLQNVWAAYLANSLDPNNQSVSANRQLINIIRQLEPDDLNTLSIISLQELNESRKDVLFKDFPDNELMLNQSLGRLTALGLFYYDRGVELFVTETGGKPLPCKATIRTSLGEFQAMPILMSLMTAIDETGE